MDYFNDTYTYDNSTIFRAQYIIDVAKKYKVKSICELGCGDGRLLQLLKRANIGIEDLLGIDQCKKAVNIALSRDSNISYAVGDITNPITFKGLNNNAFDMVFTAGTLIYIKNPEEAISQAKRLANKVVMHIERQKNKNVRSPKEHILRPKGISFWAHNYYFYYPQGKIKRYNSLKNKCKDIIIYENDSSNI